MTNMNVKEFASKLEGRILTGETGLDKQVEGIYCCDLLSWVMSHAGKGYAWITVHTHLNIVAVATLLELSCIIIPEGIEVEEATVKRAIQEGIPVISAAPSAYGICRTACKCGL
mgnify:FL=1